MKISKDGLWRQRVKWVITYSNSNKIYSINNKKFFKMRLKDKDMNMNRKFLTCNNRLKIWQICSKICKITWIHLRIDLCRIKMFKMQDQTQWSRMQMLNKILIEEIMMILSYWDITMETKINNKINCHWLEVLIYKIPMIKFLNKFSNSKAIKTESMLTWKNLNHIWNAKNISILYWLKKVSSPNTTSSLRRRSLRSDVMTNSIQMIKFIFTLNRSDVLASL